MQKFHGLSRHGFRKFITQENLLLTFLESDHDKKIITDINFDSKLQYFLDNLALLKESISAYLLFLKLINTSQNRVTFDTISFEEFENYLWNIFNFTNVYPDSEIYEFTVFEFLDNFNLLPFNIHTESIYNLDTALEMLTIYGENTIPQIVIDFLECNITSENYLDYNQELSDKFYATLQDWDFEPYSIPEFQFTTNSLNKEQIEFFLNHQNYIQSWDITSIKFEKLSKFLKKNINNQELLDTLFSLIRLLLEGTASNIATISNFRIIQGSEYYLECLIYTHNLEAPDLFYFNVFDLKKNLEIILELNNLLTE